MKWIQITMIQTQVSKSRYRFKLLKISYKSQKVSHLMLIRSRKLSLLIKHNKTIPIIEVKC